jgi:PAS domain S-box-containing protein
MTTVIAVVEDRQRSAIIEEVQRRGEALSRNLAAISQSALLLYNFTVLEQNVARAAAEADVVYAIVLDADGNVAAHSRHPDRVGHGLAGAHDARAVTAAAPLIQDAVWAETGEALYDFSVPIVVEGQRWGTARVGVAKGRMEAEIRKTRWELGIFTALALLVGGVAAAVVARQIARPVRRLADSAAAISRGELDQRIEPATADEIGRLAIAFNHMAAQLLEQRTALEAANHELRQRFQELADLKSYTDNILSSVTTGIVTVDLDGRVVTLNAAAELLTGYFAGEVAGRYCTEVFAQSPAVSEILMETLATRSPAPGVPLVLTRRTGVSVPVEFSVAPLKGADGKDLGVVGVLRDLTAVQELERRLQRSDRLAAIGTLAAGLAHEIKNPLTSLLTFSRHLVRDFDDPRFRERFQTVVPRELERINDIVERLLELSRPARLRYGPVDVARLLDRTVELYGHEIEAKGIGVRREYSRGLPPIEADEECLYQAMMNLVANALDAMPGGGRLTLRARWSDARDADLSARARQHGRRVHVEIEDSGVGIPAAVVERVFDPFFTTKDQGTGLGLSLTLKIVEDHGGTITFVSAPDSGTTFTITLPLRAPQRSLGASDA